MATTQKTFIDKCIRNDSGQITLAQAPNLPIIVWFVSTVVSKIAGTGSTHQVAHALAYGALFTWAWLEIFQGANYARRFLGVLVMAYLLVSASTMATLSA